MDEDWVLFTRYYEDGSIGSLMTDLQFIEAVPSTSPHWVAARIELQSPTEDGSLSADEIDAYQNFDQALFDALTEAGVKYVGRIAWANSVTAYGYGTVAGETLELISERLLDAHGYDLSWAQEDDQGCQRYLNDLYPTHSEWRSIWDMRLMVAAEEEGVDLSQPRSITHWAFFEDLPLTESFAAWAKENGFTADGIEEPNDASGGLWCVQLSHVDIPSLKSLGVKTIMLDAKARELGGEYDGWEADALIHEEEE